jgi:hypothetical protein
MAVTELSTMCACGRAQAESIGQAYMDHDLILHIGNALPFQDDQTYYYFTHIEVDSEEEEQLRMTFVPNILNNANSIGNITTVTLVKGATTNLIDIGCRILSYVEKSTQYHQQHKPITVSFTEIPTNLEQLDFQNLLLIQDVLTSVTLRKMFKDFCIKDWSDELMLFWEDCHKYKNTSNDRGERKLMGHRMYLQYIDQRGETPLNLTSEIMKSFNLDTIGRIDCFDRVEWFVEKDMEDIFSRFTEVRCYSNKLLTFFRHYDH